MVVFKIFSVSIIEDVFAIAWLIADVEHMREGREVNLGFVHEREQGIAVDTEQIGEIFDPCDIHMGKEIYGGIDKRLIDGA